MHYRVLFENAHMRVLEYSDKPGDKALMHSHPAYLTYVTGSGRVRDTLPNGESSVDEFVGSEFACLPPITHEGQNIGTTGANVDRNVFECRPRPARSSGPVMGRGVMLIRTRERRMDPATAGTIVHLGGALSSRAPHRFLESCPWLRPGQILRRISCIGECICL